MDSKDWDNFNDENFGLGHACPICVAQLGRPSEPSQLEYPNESAQCESKDGRFVPIMFQDYNGHYSFEQLFKGIFSTLKL